MRSFASFVEDHYGEEVADEALSTEGLSTDGAYTTVGYYPTDDLVKMVITTSNSTDVEVPVLIQRFGFDLFSKLADGHADMMQDFTNPIDLLASIESVIHVNVRRLYKDTELPRFDVIERQGDEHLTLAYSSTRPFADLAHGLVHGCLNHFGAEGRATVEREDVKADGTSSVFRIAVRPEGSEPCETKPTPSSQD
ncbi:MAG: heme NO-binding domain-containing protein [Parvularculaceae bacterium]|nr:heme NO-binding domain-containing protein [Parvularculaceae bacterium]